MNQREVGTDTEGFKTALKYVLRQDPDVVLRVGEMRDLETIEAALTISETGHLVFALRFTQATARSRPSTASSTPSRRTSRIRFGQKLSFVLQGVVSQQLLSRMGQPGRCMALEVMFPNAAIRNLIREGKIHQIYTQMQMGQDKYGMQTLNQALFALYKNRMISLEEAQGRSVEPEEFRLMIESDAKRNASHPERAASPEHAGAVDGKDPRFPSLRWLRWLRWV